jgi:hypothetical protein
MPDRVQERTWKYIADRMPEKQSEHMLGRTRKNVRMPKKCLKK